MASEKSYSRGESCLQYGEVTCARHGQDIQNRFVADWEEKKKVATTYSHNEIGE